MYSKLIVECKDMDNFINTNKFSKKTKKIILRISSPRLQGAGYRFQVAGCKIQDTWNFP